MTIAIHYSKTPRLVAGESEKCSLVAAVDDFSCDARFAAIRDNARRRQDWNRWFDSPLVMDAVELVCGGWSDRPSGRGRVFHLGGGRGLRRDWNFRRQALPTLLVFLLVPLMGLIAGLRKSPFVQKGFSIRNFSPMHFFPHFLGMSLVVVCMLIPYTAEPGGSAIFVSLPIGRRLRPFVRGVYSSLWMPVGILHVCLLGPCIWFWGTIQGILFICFSAALVSVYAGIAILLVDGFPFAHAFKPHMVSALPLIYVVGMIAALVFSAFQWLIFHDAFLVLAAAIMLAALAFAVAHVSLGKLENAVRRNLTLLGFGSQQIFRQLE